MEKPSLLYHFAHVYLRDVVLKQWKTFKSSVSAGPEVLKEELINNFNRVQQDPTRKWSKDVMLEPAAFDSVLKKLENDKELLVIRFPTPQETTEVTFVGILLEETPRYFTFELHRPTEEEKQLLSNKTGDSYKLGEWNKEGEHTLLAVNDRSIEESTSEIFANEIKQIL